MLPLYTDPSYLLDKLSCYRHDEFPATALLQNSSLMSFESNNHLGLSVQEEVNITKNGTNNVVRRKPARNDRHSKIYTAQGLRERRIRLSLEVARKFFALQDMLGFDKASTTVDWLMTQSKSAIDHEHVVNLQSKDGSSPMKRVKDQNNDQALLGQPKAESSSSTLRKRVSLHQLPTKGSRAEARARARERTKEKKKKKKEEEELLSDSQFGGHNKCCGEFLPLVMNGDDQYSGQQSNYSKNNYLISCSTSDDSLNFFQEQMNNIDGELIFG